MLGIHVPWCGLLHFSSLGTSTRGLSLSSSLGRLSPTDVRPPRSPPPPLLLLKRARSYLNYCISVVFEINVIPNRFRVACLSLGLGLFWLLKTFKTAKWASSILFGETWEYFTVVKAGGIFLLPRIFQSYFIKIVQQIFQKNVLCSINWHFFRKDFEFFQALTSRDICWKIARFIRKIVCW
jgi:hypothetical protein